MTRCNFKSKLTIIHLLPITQKICVFPVTRPTLSLFWGLKKGEKIRPSDCGRSCFVHLSEKCLNCHVKYTLNSPEMNIDMPTCSNLPLASVFRMSISARVVASFSGRYKCAIIFIFVPKLCKFIPILKQWRWSLPVCEYDKNVDSIKIDPVMCPFSGVARPTTMRKLNN